MSGYALCSLLGSPEPLVLAAGGCCGCMPSCRPLGWKAWLGRLEGRDTRLLLCRHQLPRHLHFPLYCRLHLQGHAQIEAVFHPPACLPTLAKHREQRQLARSPARVPVHLPARLPAPAHCPSACQCWRRTSGTYPLALLLYPPPLGLEVEHCTVGIRDLPPAGAGQASERSGAAGRTRAGGRAEEAGPYHSRAAGVGAATHFGFLLPLIRLPMLLLCLLSRGPQSALAICALQRLPGSLRLLV